MARMIPVRVLVIDDDPSVCRALSTWLTEAAYDAAAFTDPEEGLAYAERAGCQIGLVDLRLPGTDGVEVIARLRSVVPEARVVALAAFPEVAAVIAAVRAGAVDVLEKPLQQAALLAALERQLEALGVSVRSEEEFNRRLGARLRAARTAAGLTLNAVAAGSGLSAAQVSHIELGRTATSTWTLARLCGVLRIPMTKLLEGL